MDKNSDAPNGLSSSPCVNVQEGWLPSPVPFGDLSLSPGVCCLTMSLGYTQSSQSLL